MPVQPRTSVQPITHGPAWANHRRALGAICHGLKCARLQAGLVIANSRSVCPSCSARAKWRGRLCCPAHMSDASTWPKQTTRPLRGFRQSKRVDKHARHVEYHQCAARQTCGHRQRWKGAAPARGRERAPLRGSSRYNWTRWCSRLNADTSSPSCEWDRSASTEAHSAVRELDLAMAVSLDLSRC